MRGRPAPNADKSEVRRTLLRFFENAGEHNPEPCAPLEMRGSSRQFLEPSVPHPENDQARSMCEPIRNSPAGSPELVRSLAAKFARLPLIFLARTSLNPAPNMQIQTCQSVRSLF